MADMALDLKYAYRLLILRQLEIETLQQLILHDDISCY